MKNIDCCLNIMKNKNFLNEELKLAMSYPIEVICGWREAAKEITKDLIANPCDDERCNIEDVEECIEELEHLCFEHYRDGEYI